MESITLTNYMCTYFKVMKECGGGGCLFLFAFHLKRYFFHVKLDLKTSSLIYKWLKLTNILKLASFCLLICSVSVVAMQTWSSVSCRRSLFHGWSPLQYSGIIFFERRNIVCLFLLLICVYSKRFYKNIKLKVSSISHY